MLKNSLPEIKGRLLHYWFETYSSMNSYEEDGKVKIEYEDFYEESKHCIKEIFEISNISDLDRFCEEWGLNEMEFELSFHWLAKEYLEIKKLEPSK